MKKIFCLCPVLALLMLLNSCMSFRTIFQEPKVTFDSVKILKIDFTSASMIFRYKIDNPNSASLELAQFRYGFFIENNEFISGISPAPVKIAKEAESFVEIPVTVEYSKLFDILHDIYAKDTASYKITADFTFNLPVFGKASFPVKHEGSFPVLKLPSVSFESFKAVTITPFSALLELSLKVTNKNSFAISPDSFNFDLSVNKSQWMKGMLKNVSEMPPGKSSIVKIPVEINPIKIGKELFDYIFKGSPFDLLIDGNIAVRTSYPGIGNADIPFRVEKKTSVSE